MTALLLRLGGPLQAWGDSSRFTRRTTRQEPTKSGVLGLLAAAEGRRRTDPIEDLANLRFGVRVDQPGRLIRDFQTARRPDGSATMPLSYRYYLADAVFVAAVEGDDQLLEGLRDALLNPTFPLFLGRRSCPPAGPVLLGLRTSALKEALTTEPWQASLWYRRQQAALVDLPLLVDSSELTDVGELVHDSPVSFSPIHRVYTWRTVVRHAVPMQNDLASPRSAATHNPMAALGGQ